MHEYNDGAEEVAIGGSMRPFGWRSWYGDNNTRELLQSILKEEEDGSYSLFQDSLGQRRFCSYDLKGGDI
jgi:hypothetical protein